MLFFEGLPGWVWIVGGGLLASVCLTLAIARWLDSLEDRYP